MNRPLETIEAQPRAVEKSKSEWPSPISKLYLGRVLRREPGKFKHENMLWNKDGTGYSVGAPNLRNPRTQGSLL